MARGGNSPDSVVPKIWLVSAVLVHTEAFFEEENKLIELINFPFTVISFVSYDCFFEPPRVQCLTPVSSR